MPLNSGKTVLVLGAGASVAFNYPVGAGLRNEILDLRHTGKKTLVESSGLKHFPDKLNTFIDAFRGSQMQSIDSFLARRPEYSEIGKQAISAVLLNKESTKQLIHTEHDDNWYQYFFNRISTSTWDELDFRKFSIVTFNYDRSLEHYLLGAIQHAYGKQLSEALEKLKKLEIIHVYGSLGGTLPDSPSYIPYGYGVSPERVVAASKELKVIPEGRSDDAVLKRSRQLLFEADSIAFLGFGFDETNMERLEVEKSCAAWCQRETGAIYRNIVATCFQMTQKEVVNVATRITNSHQVVGLGQLPNGFHATGCLKMLRETLVLESLWVPQPH